ncbi:MAG: hypothetical protein COA79_03440 [Planctomycetota bacterium]|nr:MAG: hypothetical protein COA79_03440 [Planctomycetota bacterium]
MLIKTSLYILLLISAFCFVYSEEVKKKKKKPMLGVNLGNGTKILHAVLSTEKENGAVIIKKIIPGSAADRSDLLEKDLLIQVGDQKVDKDDSINSFIKLIKKYEVGDTVVFKVYRLKRLLSIDEKLIKNNEEAIKLLKENPYQTMNINQKTEAKILTYKIKLGDWLETSKLKSVPTEFPDCWNNKKLMEELKLMIGADLIKKISVSKFKEFMKEDSRINIPGVKSVQFFLHNHPLEIHGLVDGIKNLMIKHPGSIKEKLDVFLNRTLKVGKLEEVPLPKNEQDLINQLMTLMNEISKQNEILKKAYLAHQAAYDFFIQEYLNEEENLLGPSMAEKEKYLLEIEEQFQLHKEKNKYLLIKLKTFFSINRLNKIKTIFNNLNEKKVINSNGIRLVIGGSKDDIYIDGADLILDIGGDDQYFVPHERNSKAIIIDLAGNDIYNSQVDFQFGAGYFKISYLLDMQGDDSYSVENFSLGTSIFGAGLLQDLKGNDNYRSKRYSMGVGLLGDGQLLDEAGNDIYQSGIFSLGVGLYQGFGCVVELKGEDRYVSTATVKSSYGEENIFDGLSMGVGYGLRSYCRGGIGLLLDYEGNDSYHAGNFSIGQGYYFGLGGFIDLKGDDHYYANRYGIGSGAHSAIGFFVDKEGDDHYSASAHAIAGAAWDLSIAYFLDEMGDDDYVSKNTFSFGAVDHSSLAFHFDMQGDDKYQKVFYTHQTNTYHNGDSFGIFLNQNGEDKYPPGFKNNIKSVTNQFYFKDKK